MHLAEASLSGKQRQRVRLELTQQQLKVDVQQAIKALPCFTLPKSDHRSWNLVNLMEYPLEIHS